MKMFDYSDKKMSLVEHLIELRKRLFYIAISLAIMTFIAWFFTDTVWYVIQEPINNIATEQGRKAELNFSDISTAFNQKLYISFTIALLLASPFWLYQIWAFFAPAFTKKEKINAFVFLIISVPLFLSGAVLGWLLFPNIVFVMTSFAPTGSASILNAQTYYTFILKLVIVVGIAFVLPLILIFLNRVGVISGKSILNSWRIAILFITIFTAVATPAGDVISMFVLAIPMIFLYFIAAFIAVFRDKKINKINEKVTS